MFKLPLFVAFLSFLIVGCILAFMIGKLEKQDVADYQKIKESMTQQETQKIYSHQERQGVSKEIWMQHHGQNLLFRILSPQSTLFLFHENNQLEVVEQMETVQGFMQEELFYLLPDGREAIAQDGQLIIKKMDPLDPKAYIDPNLPGIIPMQSIRYMEAEKACYNYNAHLFIAENVKLWRYRIKGHDTVFSLKGFQPFMTGFAKSIEFALTGKQFNFTAHQFKASFETIGST